MKILLSTITLILTVSSGSCKSAERCYYCGAGTFSGDKECKHPETLECGQIPPLWTPPTNSTNTTTATPVATSGQGDGATTAQNVTKAKEEENSRRKRDTATTTTDFLCYKVYANDKTMTKQCVPSSASEETGCRQAGHIIECFCDSDLCNEGSHLRSILGWEVGSVLISLYFWYDIAIK